MEKYTSPCPLTDERAQEILLVLMEECSEVSHRASKMKRFGVLECQRGHTETNRDRLSVEVGDLLAMISMAADYGLIDWDLVLQSEAKKAAAFEKYSQTTKVD